MAAEGAEKFRPVTTSNVNVPILIDKTLSFTFWL